MILIHASRIALLALAGLLPQDEGPADIPQGESEVAVDTAPADRKISQRLSAILDATGHYEGARVRVEDGVVFLRGQTQDPTRRAWASELATRTEGVVAVVNDLEVREAPVWNLAPAYDEVKSLGRSVVRSLPMLILGGLILGATVLVSRSASRFLGSLITRRSSNRILKLAVEKTILGTVLLAGTWLFLRISGLTQFAATLLGGTGLVGLILGLAFRDIAENFLASLLLSAQQPFRVGDTIEVDGHTGIVRTVTLRGTVLMDFDGNYITVSNATVYKSTIKNFTANPKLRLDFAIGVGYDAGISRAQSIAKDVLTAHPAVLEDPEPLVLVDSLGAATVDLHVYCWIDGQAHSKARVRSALQRLVLRAYDKAGVSLPDEAREVIFPHGVPIQEAAPAASPQHSAPAPVEPNSSASEGEGDLSNETADLHEQARQSPSREEGEDLLSPQPVA